MSSSDQKLRVGVLLDSPKQPAWVAEMLDHIRSGEYASIELIVLNDAQRPHRSIFERMRRHGAHLVYLAYMAIEEKVFRTSPDPFAEVDLTEWTEEITVLHVTPRQTKHSDYFEDADIDRIRSFELDVLLRLGFRILRGKILEMPPLGVWSLHHGDVATFRGGPPGFWELFLDEPVTGSMLQIINEDLDNGLVLCESFSSTDNFSVVRSRHASFWKSLQFVPRMLQRAHSVGRERFLAEAERRNRQLRFYDRPMYVKPGNLAMVGLWIRNMWRFLYRRIYHALFVNRWILMYGTGDGPATSPWRYRRLMPPKDRFWADPHVVQRDGKHYVFLEEFVHRSGKAHVSVITFDEDLRPQLPAVKALEQPYHLAYPFVFEYQGEMYLVPDSRANRTVEVFRCLTFPDEWELHKTLMSDVDAVDATLLEHGGRWWMFVNMAQKNVGSNWDELHLFHADHPLSDVWTPHPLNPIVSDVRGARPAGAIFRHGAALYRPGQDCSGRGVSTRYGYALRLFEIVTLNEEQYVEHEATRIEPHWDRRIKGVHTIAHSGRLTVIDAKLRRSRFHF